MFVLLALFINHIAVSKKKKTREKEEKDPSTPNVDQKEENVPGRLHIQVMSGAALTEEHDEESDVPAVVPSVKTVIQL